jgi:hypothetical protein
MKSHLTLSRKPICSTPFPSQKIYKWKALSGTLGKSLVQPKYYYWDINKTKTGFSWSYWDSSKRSLENNVTNWGREEHTFFEISGYVQMAKSDPKAQAKSSLSDCTWLERWVWVLILNPLETPNHLEKRGALFIIFYFSLFIYTHIFSSLLFLSFNFFFFSLFYTPLEL